MADRVPGVHLYLLRAALDIYLESRGAYEVPRQYGVILLWLVFLANMSNLQT